MLSLLEYGEVDPAMPKRAEILQKLLRIISGFRRDGLITEAQYDALLKQVCAVMIERELNEQLNSILTKAFKKSLSVDRLLGVY